MIFVALFSVLINSKAFATSVVIVILGWSCPVVAFDAKVVVALSGKVTLSSSAFKESLFKCYTGGYAITKHLLYGQILRLVDICLIALIPSHLCVAGSAHEQ